MTLQLPPCVVAAAATVPSTAAARLVSSARAALSDSDDPVLSSGIAEPALQLDGVDVRGAGAAGEGVLLIQVAAELVARLGQVAAAVVVPASIAAQDG